MRTFFCLCFFLLLLYTPSLAQQRVQIKRFSEARRVVQNGIVIQKLYDVELATDTMEMSADSAWQFVELNEFRAFGNIEIVTEGKTIWSDSLLYFTDRDFSQLRGNVIIATDSSTVYGQAIDYIFSLEVALLKTRFRLEDKNGVLVADEGEYFQVQDSAVFRYNVQLSDSSQYAESDSLFINRSSGNFQMYGFVFAIDSTENTLFAGDFFKGDSTGNRLLSGNSYLRRVSENLADTTHIFADRIYVSDLDSLTLTASKGNVKMWSPDFSSVSDSSFYNSETQLFELMEEPIAWHKNIQLTAPFIHVLLDSNKVKELHTFPNPFVVQLDSSTGRLHQIKGDTLRAWMENDEMKRLRVFPNSVILYHTKNDEGEPDGAIEFSAQKSTTMFFSAGELDSLISLENPSGFFLPESPAVAGRRLDGFSWNPENRPERPTNTPTNRFDPIPLERPFIFPKKYKAFLERKK